MTLEELVSYAKRYGFVFPGSEIYGGLANAWDLGPLGALLAENIKKAWFKDLTEGDLPEKIALAFLDGDFYESIKDSLKLVERKMVNGGVIVVHDYNNLALPGVSRAVDEWLKGKDFNIEIYQSLAIIGL